MIKKSRLIFVGPIEGWQLPTNGESAKNQILLKRLKQLYRRVITIDTQSWKRNPLCLIHLGISLLFLRNSKLIISACDESAYKLITFLNKVRLQKDVCYIVIGGGLFDRIITKNMNPRNYDYLKKVIVEGHSMKKDLESIGLSNVMVVPNLKPNYNLPVKDTCPSWPIKFVFLSRIEPLKGCSIIANCVRRLNKLGRSNMFNVTYYGKVATEYQEEFDIIISDLDNVKYDGLLNLRSVEGYEILHNYDVFLFPTFYFNEGFPGVLVDAFIAGLPIIATDWHLNKEIVQDGKTGYIINPKDENALFDKMNEIINHPEELLKLARNSRRESEKYDINKVWNNELLDKIGI